MSSTVERQGEREKRGEIKQHRLRLNLKEASELCIINLIKRAFVKRRKILYGPHEEARCVYVENERSDETA
jgi:hypothetical protein